MSVSPLISAAQAVLTSLIPLATEQLKGAVFNFQDDLSSLHRRLTIIQALLTDADNNPRKIASQVMKLWLKNLKLAVCEAENVLDEVAYESLRSRLEVRKRDKVRKFFSHSNPLLFRPKIANKVKNINSLLDRICKEANEIGLSPADQLINTSIVVEPSEFTRLTHPFIDDSAILGRHGDVSLVRDMILRSGIEDDLSVIAIVGMAGLGKTTLAQLIYKDDKVVDCFGDQRMWICVSNDFSVQRLLNDMMQSLTGDKSDTQNIEGIVRKLRGKLEGKKYLLVLDDIWNTSTDKWEGMRNSLQGIGGCKGSKILVTTRSMEVISTMQMSPSHTYHLSELSSDDSWKMFRKRAFANGGPRENQTFVDIGRRMVAQCKGVPLAINALGGLLYSKQHESEWELIENNKTWKSLANEEGILPILRLSYDHLPSPCLKQCFAYCSFFPKDFEIQKDKLIRLWMGLGYLQSPSGGNLEMEDVGNEYFDILLCNSFFQEVKLDDFDNITSCKMHDLVHDLALHVAEGSCLILKASEVKNHPDVQHLSLWAEEETRLDILPENVGNLRTLFLTGHLPLNIDDVKRVRVLRLVETHGEELPISVRKFKHLRYLDLSNTKITKLPNFITCLYNLQTLVLPSSLQTFPEDFHKLVSLRHLYMDESRKNWNVIPTKVGYLTSLQTLPLFVVGGDMGHKIEELGSLNQLRGRLCVKALKLVPCTEEAEKANMIGKKDIQELELDYSIGRFQPWELELADNEIQELALNYNSDLEGGLEEWFGFCVAQIGEGVLEGLQPHKNLKSLILRNFEGRRLASWMTSSNPQFLQNLVKIKLSKCVVCEQVPALGRLPHLEVVEMEELYKLKLIGPEFYGFDGSSSSSSCGAARGGVVFPSLRKLALFHMVMLEEWSDLSSLLATATSEIKFFPCLKELLIFDCPQLIAIPGQLLSIQSITISSVESDWRDRQMMDSPSLKVCVHEKSKTIILLLEDLLGKGGRVLRKLEIVGLMWLCYLPKPQFLQNLVKIKLSKCVVCKQVPALGRLPHLEVVEMERLDTLKLIGPEFYGFDGSRSSSSSGAASGGVVFPSLRKLTLFHMKELEEWLDVSSLLATATATATSEIKFFPCLKELLIFDCPQLIAIPGQLLSIQSITISSVESDWRDRQMMYSPSLKMCVDRNLETITLLLEDLLGKSGRALRNLEIVGLMKLRYLPNPLLNLTSLEKLEIRGCSNLMYIVEDTEPAIFTGLPSLKHLSLWKCYELRCSQIMGCPSLGCDELCSLTLVGCPRWESCWQKGLLYLTSLQEVTIGGFSEHLSDFPWPCTRAYATTDHTNIIRHPPQKCPFISVESLTLEGWDKLTCLPNLEHLTALKELEIIHFDRLEYLPEWLGNLSSLQSLTISWCQNLMSFPSQEAIQRVDNLQCLYIFECPLLADRCKMGIGEEWHKIARIPFIKIEGWVGRGWAPR